MEGKILHFLYTTFQTVKRKILQPAIDLPSTKTNVLLATWG